ncbi:MAG: helix-turn-helix domain-containing protein [Angelakisella sp.]|nr:helix-turn-helix domain-containing protein [Angelakisella sp.]
MDYITVGEAAKKWGVSPRSITYHLVAGRIEGAVRKGHMWLIPSASPKPTDKRRKKDTPSLHTLLEQRDSLFSVLDLFPIPMEVFSPDGVCLFMNKVFLEFFCIPNPLDIIGKFNVLQDLFINEKLGLTDYLKRVFSGEILSVYDVKVPFEEIDNRYQSRRGNPMEHEAYQDITNFPLLREDGKVAYVITVFMTKRIYQSRLDTIKAKEYIDTHWLDNFDLDKISNHAGLSRHHLTRLFKSFIGITPYSYYQEIKLEKIKEALGDLTLNISEAFNSCGADYSGGFAEAFKKRMGMTPSEYRKTLQTEMCCNRKQSGQGKPLPVTSLSPICKSEEQLFQTAELFPIPIQIFKRNGDIVFINEAVLKLWNVKDTSQIIGKYNLIRDPFANGQPELKDGIRKAFQGDVVLIPDVRIPLENFWEWYKTRSSVYDIEAIYTDILNFSVAGADGKMAYMVAIFFTSRIYQGKSEVAKAREYLENNWREEFDIDSIAKAACISPSHLVRLFKKQTGMTPYSYYQELKVARLKEALRDKNLSVSQAFLSCGFEYPGNFARFFKEQVGMTPSQYRKIMD